MTLGGGLVRSILRRISEFRESHLNDPRFLLLDAGTYDVVRKSVRALGADLDDKRLTKLLGLTIVVVPVGEMLAVVADPWVESDKAEFARLSRAEGVGRSAAEAASE